MATAGCPRQVHDRVGAVEDGDQVVLRHVGRDPVTRSGRMAGARRAMPVMRVDGGVVEQRLHERGPDVAGCPGHDDVHASGFPRAPGR